MSLASDQIAAKLPAKPKRKASARRKPGLLHSMRAVEVEDVSAAMKKPCVMCATKPSIRRLAVRVGGGRYATESVYCMPCGLDWLVDRKVEYERAGLFLLSGPSGVASIRL